MAMNKNCADGPFRAAEREPSTNRQPPVPEEVLAAVDQSLASACIQKQILHLGLSEEDVADAGQDVKLALLRNIDRMDSRRNFRGYVYRSLSNSLTSVARAKYRSKMKSLSGEEGEAPFDVPSDLPTPLEELAEQEERQRILAALRKAPRLVRRMVNLRLKGWPFEKIARKLGVSAATVFRAVHEQIEKAREVLG